MVKKLYSNFSNPKEEEILKSFDQSPTGAYSLFPYNKNSIKSLVRQKYKRNQSYELITRIVITDFLLKPFETGRDDYINKKFPTENFIQKIFLNQLLKKNLSNYKYQKMN